MTVPRPERAFVVLPDPGQATALDELVEALRSLKVWAGAPSYGTIKNRINTAWKEAGRPGHELTGKTTVADCFRPGRRRLNTDLVIAVVQALHPDEGYVMQWRQALQVIGGQSEAAAQVRVQDRLPQDLAGFTGRSVELERLRQALRQGTVDGGAVVISAIAGMAGVGKTQLAIHAGHLLAREEAFDRVLFVNLRGFHPDRVQPPAEPAAVLEGFLRLLGVPSQQIPHGLSARAAAYRCRLAGSRTLIVLDNAANADQIRSLLSDTPGCPTLVTSRRDLTDLHHAAHLVVDVLTPEEAEAFLTKAAAEIPVGQDRHAAARIAHRCGYLPLALSLVAARVRSVPGWTLSDHADRLDERHRDRRLDTGVQLALDLSYQDLPGDRQRLLRLAALHPGQDLDPHAAAALANSDLPTARAHLGDLCRDHLLQQGTPGRYSFHDLVRAYATDRASDEDPPADRRAALTRLFHYYLATATAAMDTLYPAEAHRRPRFSPAGTPALALSDPDSARAWLDLELPALVAVAAHTAAHGWPSYTSGLSTILFRYLDGGHHTEALAIHGHALHAARHASDPGGQAHALTSLGATNMQLSRYGPAVDHHQQARQLFRQAEDQDGEARALVNLGVVEERLGDNRSAASRYARALTLFQQAGHQAGEAHALNNLGDIEGKLGRYGPATDHLQQALVLFRHLGGHAGEAWTLSTLGEVEVRQGRYEPATEHLQQALTLYRHLGNRVGEAWTLNSLGTLHTRLAQTSDHLQQALAIFRETGERYGEASALNGLGEAAPRLGDPTAFAHHTEAHTIAVDIGARDQHARALAGLAHHTPADPAFARQHYRHALTLYTDLGMPEAEQIRIHLAAIDNDRDEQLRQSPIPFRERLFREGSSGPSGRTPQAHETRVLPGKP